MSKEESKILKGIAILMMLFLHLFMHNPDGVVIPRLLKLCDPVDLFLVLGGYGMYIVWQKGDKNRWGRVLRLLTHYWLILAIFLAIGHMIKPQTYPGSFRLLVLNALTVKYSYNGEMWFLFPYICLSLLSPYIFTVCKRIRVRYILAATAVLGLGTSFIISRYGAQYLFNNDLLYDPFLIIHLMPSFLLGAMAARCNVFERIPRLQGGGSNIAFDCATYNKGICAFLLCTRALRIPVYISVP